MDSARCLPDARNGITAWMIESYFAELLTITLISLQIDLCSFALMNIRKKP